MSLGPGSSALLDLKAELLRKRAQAEEKSRQNAHEVSGNTVRKGGFRVERRERAGESQSRKRSADVSLLEKNDIQEENVLKESRRCLEEKAQRYEAMKSSQEMRSDSSIVTMDEESPTLVDFSAKRKLEILMQSKMHQLQKHPGQDWSTADGSSDLDDDGEDEWTTFTDSLGRTRKCLKTELGHFLREDDRLRKSLEKNRSSETDLTIRLPESANCMERVSGHHGENGGGGTEPLCFIEDADKEERLRRWAQVEQENAAKEHVHYRDVLFNEVREHGQAHFEFSRDETERSQQLKILDRLRDESMRAQKAALDVKKRKQDILQQRLCRVRQRKGLPSAERPEASESNLTQTVDTLSVQNLHSPSTSSLTTAVQGNEPTRALNASAYIRPWDEGKSVHGVPIFNRKNDRSGTEIYIDDRRQERLAEFAPPTSYSHVGQREMNGRKNEACVSAPAFDRTRERNSSGKDVDEFLKVMRNLS